MLSQMIEVKKRPHFVIVSTIQAKVSPVLFLHFHSRVLSAQFVFSFVHFIVNIFLVLLTKPIVFCEDAFTPEPLLAKVAMKGFVGVTLMILQIVLPQMTEVTKRPFPFRAVAGHTTEPSIFFLHFQSDVLIFLWFITFASKRFLLVVFIRRRCVIIRFFIFDWSFRQFFFLFDEACWADCRRRGYCPSSSFYFFFRQFSQTYLDYSVQCWNGWKETTHSQINSTKPECENQKKRYTQEGGGSW